MPDSLSPPPRRLDAAASTGLPTRSANGRRLPMMMARRQLALLAAIALLATTSTAIAAPLTLEGAYRLALKNNTKILIARQRLIRAINYRRVIRSRLLPSLTGSMEYTRFRQEQSFDPSSFAPTGVNIPGGKITIVPVNQFLLKARVGYLFDPSLVPLVQNVKNNIELTRNTNKEEQLQILLQVAQMYYQGLLAQQAIELNTRRIAYHRDHQKLAELRHKHGVGQKFDIIRIQIEVENAKRDLQTAKHALELAKQSLSIFIGGPQTFDLVRPAPPKEPSKELEDTMTSLRLAWSERPGITAARFGIRLAKRNILETWLKFAPTLNIGFNMSYNTQNTGFSNQQFDWNFMVVLSFNFYDGGMRYAELRERESLLQEARIKLDETRAVIANDVAAARKQLADAVKSLESSTKVLALAKQNLSLVQEGYKLGSVTNNIMLDAVNAVVNAEIGIVRDRLQRELSLLNLQRALGTFKPF
ncbi:MAG: TolC family protein [Myxococcales bacterium]|nr:TolC family protein [Myxococcales bacterium]